MSTSSALLPDDPRQIEAFTDFEERLLDLTQEARTPDDYVIALRKAYEEQTDPEIKRRIRDQYVKPAGAAVREWASLQENYRAHYGDPASLAQRLQVDPESLDPETRAIATELSDFKTFLRGFERGYQPGKPSKEIASGSTALGVWAATLGLDPVKDIKTQEQSGNLPNDVLEHNLERKLGNARPDLRFRMNQDPEFKDSMARYVRARDLYLQMGAQRDEKAQELVALGQAKGFEEAQGIIQGWLEDSHRALVGSKDALEEKHGPIGDWLLPSPRGPRGGFVGVLEDAARGILEFVAPVAGKAASGAAGILFPRETPSGHRSIAEAVGVSPESLPPGVSQLADIAIIPMNSQTLTEDMAVLLGPIGAQFKVASIPARAIGKAVQQSVPGVAGKVLGGAAGGAALFGGAEVVSPNIPLEDLGERGKRAVVAGAVGTVLGGAGGAIKAGMKPKVKAPTAPPVEAPLPVEAPPAAAYVPPSGALATPEAVKPTTEKLLGSLKAAKPIRAEQEKLMSAERALRSKEIEQIGAKVGGEEGLIAKLRYLKGKGELPKAQYESVRNQFSSEERRAMIDAVEHSRVLLPYEKMTAQKALSFKLFAEEGAVVPTTGELNLLGQVFGQDFSRAIAEKFGTKPGTATQLIGAMRSLMATGELSGTLRQAAGLGPRFPKEWARSFRTQLKSFGSEKESKAFNDRLQMHEDFLEMKKAGLAMTSVSRGTPKLTALEEEMIGANLIEKIPLAGKYFKASNRAYGDLLTSLRTEVYQTVKQNTKASGQEWTADRASAVAETINNFSGRGNLGRFENAAGALSTALFSPRYQASLLRMLDPRTYVQKDVAARKLAISSAAASLGTYSTLLALASRIPGVEVEVNPRSSDFGKAKIGKTRIDLGRGFNQIARVLAQITTGEVKSTRTGEITKLGEGFKARTKLDVVEDFVAGKLGPLPSLIREGLEGEGFDGKPFNLPKEIAERYIPMLASDLTDIARTDPSLLPWLAPLGFFGAGLQTYPVGDPVREAVDTAEKEGKGKYLPVKNLRKQYNAAKKLKGEERRKAMAEVEADANKILAELEAGTF